MTKEEVKSSERIFQEELEGARSKECVLAQRPSRNKGPGAEKAGRPEQKEVRRGQHSEGREGERRAGWGQSAGRAWALAGGSDFIVS